MIKLATLLCLGGSRRKREKKAETHPRVWLGIPVLWSYTGKMESHWDYQKGCEWLDSTCEEHAHASFPPEAEHRGQIEDCSTGCQGTCNCLTAHPSKHHIPTYLTRQHNTGSKTAMTKQKSQLLKAGASQYWGSIWVGRQPPLLAHTQTVLTIAQNTGCCLSPQLITHYIPRVHAGPACVMVWLQNRAGMTGAGYSDWPWGTKGTLTQGCIWTQWGEQLPVPAQATHQRYLKTLSTDNTSGEPTSVPFAWALLTLGQKFQGWDRNHTLKGNWAHSGLALRTTAPATWDYSALPLGWWWPLRRGEVRLHTKIQL